MKTASNNLISLLQTSNQFYMAELYTITLANNTALRYTTLDSDVSWNGNNFASQGLLLKRSRITQAVGLETSELEIEAMPTNATIGNVGFLAAARNGALDGAFVKLERIFYPYIIKAVIMTRLCLRKHTLKKLQNLGTKRPLFF